jgi:hypothetical protein
MALGKDTFTAACGLSCQRFLQLHTALKDELAITTLHAKGTEKKKEGRPRAFSTQDQLLMLFLWLRHYPSTFFLGLLFGGEQTLVSRYLRATLSTLNRYFTYLDLICFPKYVEREKNGVWLFGDLITLVIDCTEQKQPNATNKHDALARASGKKASPTWMKQVGCAPKNGYIYALSHTYLGSNNDPMVYKRPENRLHEKLRANETIAGDAAYSFIRKWHSVRTNKKDDTTEGKHYNRSFIAMRLIIENLFGTLKARWSVLHDIFIHGQEMHHEVWYVLCSLHNLEIIEESKTLRDEQSWLRWERKCLQQHVRTPLVCGDLSAHFTHTAPFSPLGEEEEERGKATQKEATAQTARRSEATTDRRWNQQTRRVHMTALTSSALR